MPVLSHGKDKIMNNNNDNIISIGKEFLSLSPPFVKTRTISIIAKIS